MASSSIDTFDPLGNDAPRPASILLYERPYISDDSNETTATAKSIGGHTMAVSLWIADPPGMTFFSVACSRPPNSDPKRADFRDFPHVVGAEGRFVLLRVRFFFFLLSPDEYFMYKASDAESPSLDSVPLPPPDADYDLRRVREFGIVPCGHGGHYLLAALREARDAPLDYKLHTYSSKRKTWSSITLPNPCTEVRRIIPEKVITIGEGVLGWVDFSCGLLVCNLNQDPPNANFIPLPEPLPGNRDKVRALLTSGSSPRLFRDITCVDGVLKFVEVEHRVIDTTPEKSSDPSDKGVLYDSDLITSLKRKDMDEKPKKQRSRYGWRAVTWSRMISSNCWHKGCAIDVSDIGAVEILNIVVDESTRSSLPSGLQGKTSGGLTFWDLYSAFPTYSMDGGDILYLKSMVEPNDHNGWVVAVDLQNKRVEAFRPWSFVGRAPFEQAFRSCTLSNHLKMTPGIKASAYRKITQAGCCADDPKKTPIFVDATSCQWRSKFQRLSAKEVNHARNEAPIVAQNVPVAGAVLNPDVDRRAIQAREIQRILSEEIFNRAQNGDWSMVQNHVSRVPPVRNILPPKQSISDQNCPHNNEYQPLWPQPPSSQQQQMANQLWNS